MNMYIVQLGKKIRLIEAGLGSGAGVGSSVSMYREAGMKECDAWTVIKVFDREELLRLQGLKRLLGDEGFKKFFDTLFAFDVLG